METVRKTISVETMNEVTKSLRDKQYILDHVTIHLASDQEINSEAKCKGAAPLTRPFLDLHELYVVDISDIMGNYTRVVLGKKAPEGLGITMAELHKAALTNIRKNGTRKIDIDTIIEHARELGIPINPAAGGVNDIMIALTNNTGFRGANVMLDIQNFASIAETLDSDLYILPSSVHEVIVTPAKIVNDVDWLKETVQRTNTTAVSEEDFLSNSVYYYDRHLEEILIAK